MPKFRKKKIAPKRVLAVPDLEQAKSAVLNTGDRIENPNGEG